MMQCTLFLRTHGRYLYNIITILFLIFNDRYHRGGQKSCVIRLYRCTQISRQRIDTSTEAYVLHTSCEHMVSILYAYIYHTRVWNRYTADTVFYPHNIIIIIIVKPYRMRETIYPRARPGLYWVILRDNYRIQPLFH